MAASLQRLRLFYVGGLGPPHVGLISVAAHGYCRILRSLGVIGDAYNAQKWTVGAYTRAVNERPPQREKGHFL